MNFKEFLNLNESLQPLNKMFNLESYKTFKLTDNLSDVLKLQNYGKIFSKDGKYSISLYKDSVVVFDTINYGKNGTSKCNIIYVNNKAVEYVNDIFGHQTVKEFIEMSNEKKSKYILEYQENQNLYDSYQVREGEFKNISDDAFNPFIMQKNVKSPGAFANDKKLNKTQLFKIIASGDYTNLICNYKYTDDYALDNKNNFNRGNVEDVSLVLSDIARGIYYSPTVKHENGYEVINFAIHSNLSYTLFRKIR